MEFLRHKLSEIITNFTRNSEGAVQDVRIVDGRVIYPDQESAPIQQPAILTPSPRKVIASSANEILTLDELLHHKNLQKGYIPIGLTRKSNELVQSTLKKMTTGVIAGRRNFGKSSILKSLSLCCLHARKKGLRAKLYLFDPHHNLPDSTGLFFKPILHQFDECFLGMESLERGRHLELFSDIKASVQEFQEGGFDENAPWHIFFIDEADLFFKNKKFGKDTYRLIEHLINLRKGRLFFLLSFADTTKAGSGDIGTSLVAAGTSVFCVNYDLARARVVLQGPNEARKALNLPVGYAAVKIPDQKVQVCRMPYVTEKDLIQFLPAQSATAQPSAPQIRDGQIVGFQPADLVMERNGIRIYSPTSQIEVDDEPVVERLSEEAIRIEIERLAQMMDSDENGRRSKLPEAEEPPPQVPATEEHPPPTSPPAPEVQPVANQEPAARPQQIPAPQQAEAPDIPGFLTDGDTGDFDGFVTWLEASKKSQRTVAEYGRNLKSWKRALDGDATIDAVNAYLESLSYHKAIRMKAVINAYAEYRCSIDDDELKILLALNPFTPQNPQDDAPDSNGGLSAKESDIYWATARELCQEGKRAGIWIGLSLLGIRASEIERVKRVNQYTLSFQRRKTTHTIPCPNWLMEAMKAIAEDDWRKSRKTVHKEVSAYEITPSALNSAAQSDRA